MRLGYYVDTFFDMDVSIHASVKDATLSFGSFRRFQQVSIHASVKDATLTKKGTYIYYGVSIHASVKDATSSQQVLMALDKFQSTHL